MDAITGESLQAKHCVPCEGGVPKLSSAEIDHHLAALPGWQFLPEPDRIRKEWTAKHFRAGMAFLNLVAELAEQEGHHPDVHITGYRRVAIEIWTHAITGLSENDFILAAKVDALPIAVK